MGKVDERDSEVSKFKKTLGKRNSQVENGKVDHVDARTHLDESDERGVVYIYIYIIFYDTL